MNKLDFCEIENETNESEKFLSLQQRKLNECLHLILVRSFLIASADGMQTWQFKTNLNQFTAEARAT